jgi:O-antigen/teichoic acid export membrane protein
MRLKKLQPGACFVANSPTRIHSPPVGSREQSTPTTVEESLFESDALSSVRGSTATGEKNWKIMPSAAEENAKTLTRSSTARPARSVLSNWMTYVVSGAVSFFLSPFIVRHLGNSAYGVWVLLVSMTGYLGFLDLGIRGAVTRYVAKFHSQGDHERSSWTVSSACGLFLSAGAIAVVAAFIFSVFAVPHFKIPPAYLKAAQLVVLLAGLNVAISLISGVFGGVIVGLQRFDLLSSIAIGGIGLRAMAILIALGNGKGLVTLALIQLGGTLCELLLGLAVARKLYPELRIGIGNVRRDHVALVFSFGFYAFLLHLSNYFIFFTDALVIGAFVSVSMVTFFAIGGNLANYGRDLVGGFSRTMTPLASKLEVEAGREGLQHAILKQARYCALAMWPIFITLIFRGSSFIGLWMGSSYAELSGHVLWILSVPWFVGTGTSVVASAMLGISQHKRVVPFALAEGLGNLLLSIALVKSMGILGVAWGTALPNLAIGILFWPWYIRRTLGIPLRDYAFSLWLRPAIAMLPFTFFTLAVNRWWHASNLLFFFAQVAAIYPSALVGVWYLGLSSEERHIYAQFLSRVLRPGRSV